MPKFSDLPTANSVGASDTFAILQDGALKQAPYSTFANSAIFPAYIETKGASAGLNIGPRDGTGTSFLLWNPTGDALHVSNGASNVLSLTSNGALSTAQGITVGGSPVVTMANAASSISTNNSASPSLGTGSRWAREDHNHGPQLAMVRRTLTGNATLQPSDNGGVVAWNAANGTITLPRSLPEGFNCLVRVVHATGTPTFVGQTSANGNAVVNQADGKLRARKQWSEVSVSVHSSNYVGDTIPQTGGNVWVVSGDVDS